MKFEKRNFMGIELDVLVGHPEHELLFVATQVARAAGLKNPSQSVNQFKNVNANVGGLLQFRDVTSVYIKYVDQKAAAIPGNPGSAVVQANSWVGTEAWVYNMLLKGHAKASEPFRKWVTEEVLPTIRKTGSYNAEESTNPIAMGIMDELKLLRMELKDLKDIVKSGLLAASAPKVVVKSPYEGTTKGTAHYHCDARMIREAAEVLGLTRPVVDKMVPRVMLRVESRLSTMWTGPELEFETSSTGKKWTVYPTNWLKQQLTREFVRSSLQAIVNEVMAK